MISPYLSRPSRSLSEAIGAMAAEAQAHTDHRIARGAVAFMLARFRDMRHCACTGAQAAAYDREIAELEAYLLRHAGEEAGA